VVDAAAREAEKGTSIGEVAVRHGCRVARGEAECAARELVEVDCFSELIVHSTSSRNCADCLLDLLMGVE
jgi:hypothetical protein